MDRWVRILIVFAVMVAVGCVAMVFTAYLNGVWNKARLYDFYATALAQLERCLPYKATVICNYGGLG